MPTSFFLSKEFIDELEEYDDSSFPLLRILEESQSLLFKNYLARRRISSPSFSEISVDSFMKIGVYLSQNSLGITHINGYGLNAKEYKSLEGLERIECPVREILDDDYPYKNKDALLAELDKHPTITDWFKRLLDHLSPSDRNKIHLELINIRKYEDILKSERKKIEKEVISVNKPVEPLIIEKSIETEEDNKPVEIITEPITQKISEPIEEPLDEENEKALEKAISLEQEKANALVKRMKERIGIHFGWDEIEILYSDEESCFSQLERKVRKNGLKDGDKDWIIVMDYYTDEGLAERVKEAYKGHAFYSDDIKNKPSPEYVRLTLLLKERKLDNQATVKKVESKQASFSLGINKPMSAIEEESEEEEDIIEEPKKHDYEIKKVKVKGAYIPPVTSKPLTAEDLASDYDDGWGDLPYIDDEDL